jgi:RNA-binding protein
MIKTELKELKKQANTLKPEFNLGKNGITTSFVDTIDKYLEVHNIVKIKVLIAIDKDGVKYYADEISKTTESEIIDRKGFTFTIYRKSKK